MILNLSISEETMERLKIVSSETGRTPEDLAESAVAEAALEATKHRYRKAPRYGGKLVNNLVQARSGQEESEL